MIFAIAGTTSAAAAHDWTQAVPEPQAYVQPQLLPPQLLPPPPAEGSVAWHQQVESVLKAQRRLSAGAIAAIQQEQRIRIDLLTSIMGSSFTRDRLPQTFALLDRVFDNAAEVTDADKQFWHTRRPYLTDPRVRLYVDRIDASPSYPSGHTCESRVLAEVLGLLAPQKRDALRARADAIATDRIKAGAHYPVDIDSGRLLAMLVVGALMNSDDFQKDLTAARQEMNAAGIAG